MPRRGAESIHISSAAGQTLFNFHSLIRLLEMLVFQQRMTTAVIRNIFISMRLRYNSLPYYSDEKDP